MWTLLYLQSKRTTRVIRCCHTSQQTAHWGSLDESNRFSMWLGLFSLWQCAVGLLFVWDRRQLCVKEAGESSHTNTRAQTVAVGWNAHTELHVVRQVTHNAVIVSRVLRVSRHLGMVTFLILRLFVTNLCLVVVILCRLWLFRDLFLSICPGSSSTYCLCKGLLVKTDASGYKPSLFLIIINNETAVTLFPPSCPPASWPAHFQLTPPAPCGNHS